MSDLKTVTVELRAIFVERTRLLNDRLFFALTKKEQLHYCRLNKKLMEKYWEHYEAARKEGSYDAAALSFAQAFQLGLPKAMSLVESINNTTVTEQLIPSEDATQNFIFGLRYALGLGVIQSNVEAARWLEIAAKQEHAEAQLFLGRLYYSGYGVEKNRELAKQWLERAAAQGTIYAIYYLGNFIEVSKNQNKDNLKDAFVYYEKAARLGQMNAQNNVGVSYKCGDGVELNLKKAIPWLTMSAEQGEYRSQFNLGHCYWFGQGVAVDKIKAVHWFGLSAEQGFVKAQHYLALAYYHGEGVAQDTNTAIKWFKKAAHSGHKQSAYDLGLFYLNGDGVKKNIKEAVRWFVAAKKSGRKSALKKIETINTSAAKVAAALLNGNESQFLHLVLEHYEQVEWLYSNELSYFLAQKPENLNYFYGFLSSINKEQNKNANNFLLNTLIILESGKGMDKLTVDLSSCISKMIEQVDIANIPPQSITAFTHAVLNRAYPDNSVLAKLWYRLQSCDKRMDSGLSRLFASQIVRNLFNETYSLNCADLTRDNLIQLVAASEMEDKLTPEELNARFRMVLIIPSWQHPEQLLPKLKECISGMQKKTPVSLYLLRIAELISGEVNGQTKRGWHDTLASVQALAQASLWAQGRQNMFRAQMSLVEKALLVILRKPDMSALNDWIMHRELTNLPDINSLIRP